MAEEKTGTGAFAGKVWIAASIVALLVVLIWIARLTFSVWLLVLAAVLIGLYFQGLSRLLHRKLHLSSQLSLPLAIIGSLLLLGLFFWFTGSRIQQELAQLSDTLPSAMEAFKNQLSGSPLGEKLLQKMESGGGMEKAGQRLASIFRTSFGVLGDLYVILFLGLFFTASPGTYTKGFLQLVPPTGRDRAERILQKIAFDLTKWLKGKLMSMGVVAVLTAIGLTLIGLPMAFALALIAGLLNFIPNFGPLLAMVPAVLVGLMQDPTTALLVAGLYLLVQVLESNLITPQIQKRLVSVPPALIILAQLFMGVLTGGWGIVLATPVVLILIVLLQELYIQKPERKGARTGKT